ncbi:DUF4374 domain-containing protein [Reichenbachiella sp. MALMAid0571]|uniref:DUF4374 domain-containing protein n=1 Tax=Reichenbachiella sp. MALMAid0571 TaxID=3143939 RepID=UPI0032E030F3
MYNKYCCYLFIACIGLLSACSDDDPLEDIVDNGVVHYFVGIEAATDPTTDVLTPAGSLTENLISPVDNGFAQPAWMTFFQGYDQIFTTGYTSAPEFISYELVDGELTKGESFFTDLGIYALYVVDESKMVLIGSAREGQSDKKIYLINTNTMTIEKTVETGFGNDPDNNLMAFPTDVAVRDDKLFASYMLMSDDGSFATTNSNEAKIAVFSYPELEFEKIISDDRAANVGRYYTLNALEEDENGNIYTFSPSSLTSGYNPVPANNSAILRIKSGATEFDPSFYIDFETLSEGYKINDMYYVADGKAVVRVHLEDETMAEYYWAAYAPTSETPILETGILDLNNKTFTLLENVPKGGGGWNSAVMVEGKKLYLGVSNSTYASIYVIDVENGTATEGATIDGNYAKGILSLVEPIIN